jgi:hypothetical protein
MPEKLNEKSVPVMYHTQSRTPFFWHSAGKVLTTYKSYTQSCQIFTSPTIKYIFFFEHVACRMLDKYEWSVSQSKCPALRERERGGSQVSLETVVKRKNPYLCHAKNHGYHAHNQLLNLVTHMHKCTLLNLTVFWILIFQKHSNLMACITRQKVRNEFPSPSYETQEHVDLAVVCTCPCCHI